MDLSLKAAVEIEQAISGAAVDEAVVQRMIDALDSAFASSTARQSPEHLADPRVVMVYGRAVNRVDSAKISTVQGVREWVEDFASRYRPAVSERPKKDLSYLRDFFLALHRELLATMIAERPESYAPGRGHHDSAISSAAY